MRSRFDGSFLGLLLVNDECDARNKEVLWVFGRIGENVYFGIVEIVGHTWEGKRAGIG